MNQPQHISFEALADLAERRILRREPAPPDEHISHCLHCAGDLRRLEELLELMTTDNSKDAPRDVMASAINLFRERHSTTGPSLLERVLAVLNFDSGQRTPAFGVRAVETTARQLIYSAGDNDIELRITPRGEEWLISGQVLGKDCAEGQIVLEGEGTSASAPLNELCEFRLPGVGSGNYRIRLQLRNLEVEVPQLELR